MSRLCYFPLAIFLFAPLFTFGQGKQPCWPDIGTAYDGGVREHYVLAADFNGDTHADLALANSFTSSSPNELIIFMNQGDGTFAAGVGYTSHLAEGIECADLDGDLDLDIVVATSLPDGAIVFFNDGNGTFTESQLYEGYSNNGWSLSVADFDGDGDNDIAFGSDYFGDGINFLLNDGTGQFTLLEYFVSTCDAPYSMVADDVDGDGDIDLAIGSGFQFLEIWLNDGAGQFPEADAKFFVIQSGGCSIASGDLDNDGDQDLALNGNYLETFLNDGVGNFSSGGIYDEISGYDSLVINDLDGDSDLDVVQLNYVNDRIHIYQNDGNGDFDILPTISTSNQPNSLAVADLNGDQQPDFIVGHCDLPDVLVYLSGCDVLLGDVNLDGDVNLLDVAPFVEILLNADYQAEADINQDGEVNLLDVGPFVDILSGG